MLHEIMFKDHLLHCITLSLTDSKKNETFCLAWLKVSADLCDVCAQLARCMKMSVLPMNFFVLHMRFDVFWAGLHSAIWQLQCPVSGDKWEMAGSQILTNVLTFPLSCRHLMWLIIWPDASMRACCHSRFPYSISPWRWMVLVDFHPNI